MTSIRAMPSTQSTLAFSYGFLACKTEQDVQNFMKTIGLAGQCYSMLFDQCFQYVASIEDARDIAIKFKDCVGVYGMCYESTYVTEIPATFMDSILQSAFCLWTSCCEYCDECFEDEHPECYADSDGYAIRPRCQECENPECGEGRELIDELAAILEDIGFVRAADCDFNALRYEFCSNHLLAMKRTRIDKYFPYDYEGLKQGRRGIFSDLQEYVHHPSRIQKWLDDGNNVEDYMN